MRLKTSGPQKKGESVQLATGCYGCSLPEHPACTCGLCTKGALSVLGP